MLFISESSSSSAEEISDIESGSARTPYRQCSPGKSRIRLDISYDGTGYNGWQRQTQTPNTIQGTLERAVGQIYGEKIAVIGASRTDAGVHAQMQVAHFDAPKAPGGFDLRYSLQCQLPESIVIKKLYLAPDDFHSIACVKDKTYRYHVLNRHVPSALRRRYSHWVRLPLNVENLNKFSEIVVGTHDFKAFQTAGTVVKSTVRTIREASWERTDDDLLTFTVRGDGFLKQMVRNLVGTMVDLEREGQGPEEMRRILQSCDRRKAGATVPAGGLFLNSVRYPQELDNQCRHLY